MKQNKVNLHKVSLRDYIMQQEIVFEIISKKLPKKYQNLLDGLTKKLNKISFELDPAINFSIPEDTEKVFDEFLNEDYSFVFQD